MDRLKLTKNEVKNLSSRLIKERKDNTLKNGDFNTYRKLMNIMFETFDTYLKLDNHIPDYDFGFYKWYYKAISNEANNITPLLDNALNEQYRYLIEIRNSIFKETINLEKYCDINFNIDEDVVECSICHREYSKDRVVTHFYPSNTTESGRMEMCKECIKYLYNQTGEDVKELLRTNDLIYIEDLWEASKEKQNPIGYYFKIIFSLPQFKDKKWNNIF